MLKISARPGRRRRTVRGIGQIRGLDPTLVQRAANNIVEEKLLEFPDAVLFDVFVFPDAAADQCTQLSAPIKSAQEEAVPSALGIDAVRFNVDNTAKRHQDVQVFRGRFFNAAVGGIVVAEIKRFFNFFPTLVLATGIDFQGNIGTVRP